MRDAVALDGGKALLGIELLHHHHGYAHRVRAHRPQARRCVIERGGADVHRVAGDADRHQQIPTACSASPRAARCDNSRRMPLGRPVVPEEYCSRSPSISSAIGVIGFVGNALGVALPAVEVVVGDHQQIGQAVRQMLGQPLAHLAHRLRADDGLGAAVVDDVRRLWRGEVGADHRVVQPAAPRRPHHRVQVLVVLHQHRDGVALDEACPPEAVREPVGPRLHLRETYLLTRRVQDDGGPVGVRFGVFANLHAPTLRRPNLTGVKTPVLTPSMQAQTYY